uniref:Uncharacterized protein n=1 Tax=Zea mays TaxID=4577 RepID=A0A804LF27_MAIZE
MEVARQLYGRVTGEAVYVAEPVSAPARRGSPTKGCLGAMRLVAGPRRKGDQVVCLGFDMRKYSLTQYLMNSFNGCYPTIVLVHVWGIGHFVPMLEVGKRLLARSARLLTITVLVTPELVEAKRAFEITEHIR